MEMRNANLRADRDADFLVYSPEAGVLSEHCSETEARFAFFQYLRDLRLGDRVPAILRRQEEGWTTLSRFGNS